MLETCPGDKESRRIGCRRNRELRDGVAFKANGVSAWISWSLKYIHSGGWPKLPPKSRTSTKGVDTMGGGGVLPFRFGYTSSIDTR